MEKKSLIAIFVFYSKANGIQAGLAFSEQFRHCNIIVFDGADWIMIDFDRTGLVVRKINCKTGEQLLRLLPINQDVSATVSVMIRDRVSICWKPWWVRSCNEICRYASGVDIGFTFNPIALYEKLLRYRSKRNYEVLSAWRRKHGVLWRRRQKRLGKANGGTIQPEQAGIGTQESQSVQDAP